MMEGLFRSRRYMGTPGTGVRPPKDNEVPSGAPQEPTLPT
jgi:hypothetical protein